MPYQSTKKFGPISTDHRNWHAAVNTERDSVKCARLHGYGRYVQLTFAGDLDEMGWVFDFGMTKNIKKFLEDNWDHRTLIASDDPELEFLQTIHDKGLISMNIMDVSKGWTPAIEGSCKFVFDHVQPVIHHETNGRVHIAKVEIWEHENNSAVFIPTEKDFMRATIKSNKLNVNG